MTEAIDGNATQRYWQLLSERSQVAPHGVPIAAMVLDDAGTVCYCHADAARLFRAGAHTLVGSHVNELIPDLPFNSRTHGYNIAYATFWAPKGMRRGFCGVDREGRSFGLELALERLELERHYHILLRLRLAVESLRLPQRYTGIGNRVHAGGHRAEIPAFAG